MTATCSIERCRPGRSLQCQSKHTSSELASSLSPMTAVQDRMFRALELQDSEYQQYDDDGDHYGNHGQQVSHPPPSLARQFRHETTWRGATNAFWFNKDFVASVVYFVSPPSLAHFTVRDLMSFGPGGYFMSNFSMVFTITLATTRSRYHLWLDGTAYHGAQSVLVFSRTCS